MGFSVRGGVMLAVLLGLAGCAAKPATTTFVSQPQTDPMAGMQRSRTALPGTAWTVACVSFPHLPPDRRQSCRAELALSAPGQPAQANFFTMHAGRHWTLASNIRATGLTVQVAGRPNSHVGRCANIGICVLEDTMALTEEMRAGSQVIFTVMTAEGGMRSQVATAGMQEAIRLAVAGTSPAAIGDRPVVTVR